jgi:diaminopimelate epimerase
MYMNWSLTKHHGLGNDFLVFDRAQGTPERPWPELAVAWCDRRTGIGADGLLILDRIDEHTLGMELYNADGSRAEMSGNGIRCLAQAAYIADRRNGAHEYSVFTDAGVRVLEVVEQSPDDIHTLQIEVHMGTVEPLDEPDNWSVLECHPDRPVRHVSLGNPHSVVGVENVLEVDLASLGAKVPHINLEIIEPGPEQHAITLRVHERGAGITMACGTGACAGAEAALAWGLVPASVKEVLVHMDGGDASVRINRDAKTAVLIGPATFVASIVVNA